MKKQLKDTQILLEILILTAAVAIIAAAVYFFLVPSHTSVSSISGLGIVLSNFVPWCKNRLHQYHASCFSWTF